MDLLILAGGMGSRFGGDKQVEKIDDNGNSIMDYSIFDAISTGFDKIVIIVKENLYNYVKQTYKQKIGEKAKLKVIVQSDKVLKKYKIDRKKPLGTGHAILCAKNAIKDNFCMINADDFYGKKSFALAYEYLKNTDKKSTNFGLIGYELENTLSKNGSVKRGVCKAKNNFITSIDECKISIEKDKILATRLENNEQIELEKNNLVSMNMFCFTPKIFAYLKKYFKEFCDNKNNLIDKEFLIPEVVDNMIKTNQASLKLVPTKEKWIGMTYKEDLDEVKEKISILIDKKNYPKDLWK